MSRSLNETEALSKSAARGSGLSWGLAEEAAKGTRWLLAFGFPGAGLLADLLEMNDHIPVTDLSPVSLVAEVWESPSGRLSPLVCGASLSDCAKQLITLGTISMKNVCFPLLTIPFMGRTALHLGVPVVAQWKDAQITTDGRKISVEATGEAVSAPLADRLVFSAPAEMHEGREALTRAGIPDADWKRLSVFAHRTFAPATEESRIRGAGAGLSDND